MLVFDLPVVVYFGTAYQEYYSGVTVLIYQSYPMNLIPVRKISIQMEKMLDAEVLYNTSK